MENLLILVQLTIAISVYYVWIFRYFNVEKEFLLFGLSDVTRNFVGACKLSFAALLVASIWYHDLKIFGACGMAFFMISAQYFHFKVKNPFIKHLPSLVLLLLCLLLIFK